MNEKSPLQEIMEGKAKKWSDIWLKIGILNPSLTHASK